MFGFFKKKAYEPETQLKRDLREATLKIYNKRRDDYVESLLKQCRDATERGEFKIVKGKESEGVFYDWAIAAHNVLKTRGLNVIHYAGNRVVEISWK